MFQQQIAGKILMHRINGKSSFSQTFGRVLSSLAVVMLVVIGGTFAHADINRHHHASLTGKSIKHPSSPHAHFKDGSNTIKSLESLHCGGEILFSARLSKGICYLPGTAFSLIKEQGMAGLSKGLDPPPPRLFSSVI